jgi:hypothetical protein
MRGDGNLELEGAGVVAADDRSWVGRNAVQAVQFGVEETRRDEAAVAAGRALFPADADDENRKAIGGL